MPVADVFEMALTSRFGRVTWVAVALFLVLASCGPEEEPRETALARAEHQCAWSSERIDEEVRRHVDDGRSVFKLYFLGGQSNMAGYGWATDLPSDLTEFDEDVLIFQGNPAPDGQEGGGLGVWAPLRSGHGTDFTSDGAENSYTDRFGPELGFARRIRELDPGAKVALVKYARNGSAIDSLAAGRAGSWAPSFVRERELNQYDHFLATLRNAFAVGDIDGDGEVDVLIPAGIVWMQGESDGAYSREIALRYADNLRELVGLMRAALRRDDLPVVIGRISDSGQHASGKVWEHGTVVRAAQEFFVSEDPCAALVSTDEYGYSDIYHYDSEGYIDLGEQFASELGRLLGLQSGRESE